MATFLLIRHAAHDDLGHRLSGRLPGLELSDAGRAQAAALATRLAHEPLAAVRCSPLARTTATAAAIALPHALAVERVDALTEIDFGDWTGRSFAELDGDAAWDRWNAARGTAAVPNGERMVDAQARIMACLDTMAVAEPDATIAVVTHCDMIRAVVCRVLDLSLDRLLRFEVGPASVTRIAVVGGSPRLLSLNEGENR